MSKKLSKQISLGNDPMTGKRIRKWIHADTKAGLKQAEKDAISQFAREGAPSHITYGEYEQKWFDAFRSQVEPHTKATTWSVLNHNKELRHRKLRDITRTDLQKIINDNWDRVTLCRSYASMMKSIWESAMSDGICTKNIAVGLKLPKVHKTVRRPLTENELSGISKAEFDHMERFIVDVLLQFGLRPGEAFALNKQSFDKKRRVLVINKALAHNGNQPYIKSTKTGVTRELPVPDSFWSKIPDVDTFYYFVNADQQLMKKSQIRCFQTRVIRKINIAMGGSSKLKLTDMTFYNFRHHKASLLYYLPGVSIKKKAQYMGHSEKMFLETYSHMMEAKEDVEALREAVNL